MPKHKTIQQLAEDFIIWGRGSWGQSSYDTSPFTINEEAQLIAYIIYLLKSGKAFKNKYPDLNLSHEDLHEICNLELVKEVTENLKNIDNNYSK